MPSVMWNSVSKNNTKITQEKITKAKLTENKTFKVTLKNNNIKNQIFLQIKSFQMSSNFLFFKGSFSPRKLTQRAKLFPCSADFTNFAYLQIFMFK